MNSSWDYLCDFKNEIETGNTLDLNIEKVPQKVRQFIFKNIHSVTQLVVLLYLFRVRPQPFSASQIASELRSNPEIISKYLKAMCERGLCSVLGEFYSFDSKDKEVESTIESLEKSYSTFKIQVIEIIYAERSNAIAELANAFKFRKDDD